MDAEQSKKSEGIGSVKDAVNLFGEMARRRKLDNYIDQLSKTRDLFPAKMGNGQVTETKNIAKNMVMLEESELSSDKSIVKQLALQIEESRARTKTTRLEPQSFMKTERIIVESQYLKLMQELDKSKQELNMLKLSITSAMKSKSKAEKQFEAWSSKSKSYQHPAEQLKKKIEEIDEEHVLVELARLEAEKELQEIEAKRRNEADNFIGCIKDTKNRIEEFLRELEYAKVLEAMLAATNSEVNILQNELKQVRAMEKNFETDTAKRINKHKEVDSSKSIDAEAELRAAKQELSLLEEEGFQLMTSIDQARQELIQVAEETCHLEQLEKKAESKIQHLNSKLSKAKSKLEDASAADERTKSIIFYLTAALEQLEMERNAAKWEEELMTKETSSNIKELKETNLQITFTQEKLRDAAQVLLTVKALEAKALNKLKKVSETIMKNRTSSVLYKSFITISQSEYAYLSQRAAAAKVVANKKVAAAHAWVEALAAEEKEINMKADQLEKEMRKLQAEEAREIYQKQNPSTEEILFTSLPDDEEKNGANLQLVPAKQRKSNSGLSSSSAGRYPSRSPSFTIKKRTKVMLNLMKFFSNQINRKRK